MKLFTTNQGIAREASDGKLEILDLAERDLGALLAVDPELKRARSAGVLRRTTIEDIVLLAPVLRPGKVIGIGINYSSHVAETSEALARMGIEVPTDPIFFLAPGSAVIGPEDPIVLPKIAPERVDYEIELAVVIGQGGTAITEAEAFSHVAGYTLANDVSARDIQSQAMTGPQFELSHAKGMDSFKPMGPALVTADEFELPLNIHLETRVNGAIRQDAWTTEFVHSLPSCIAYISRFMRLDPGDVIITGSPSGVGHFQNLFLKHGDVVELTADKIGTLQNPVVTA
jgi:2-keto-4-pentenoate hydratase/2-oxohepta-3-ene-1,7-dioic acid hydratase in catechol pathway